MINGLATILLTLFIDPKSAVITDQAMRGDRPYEDVKVLVILLIASKLIGTMLGQVLSYQQQRLSLVFMGDKKCPLNHRALPRA